MMETLVFPETLSSLQVRTSVLRLPAIEQESMN